MYTKIESEFWKDEKMLKISANGRYLMLYLLTSPHRNIIGCYFLPAPYAYFDLGWSPEQFQEALNELCESGRIQYDVATHILFIPNYLKFNPVENPNQVKSAIDKLKELPQTPLLQNLMTIIESFNKPYLKPLIEQLRERLAQPVYSNSKQYTEDDIYNAPAHEDEKKNEKSEEDSYAKEILDIVHQEFGLLNSFDAEIVKDWIDHFPRDWIIHAVKKSKGKNIKYADKIMSTWLTEGCTNKDKPWEIAVPVKKKATGLEAVKNLRRQIEKEGDKEDDP